MSIKYCAEHDMPSASEVCQSYGSTYVCIKLLFATMLALIICGIESRASSRIVAAASLDSTRYLDLMTHLKCITISRQKHAISNSHISLSQYALVIRTRTYGSISKEGFLFRLWENTRRL